MRFSDLRKLKEEPGSARPADRPPAARPEPAPPPEAEAPARPDPWLDIPRRPEPAKPAEQAAPAAQPPAPSPAPLPTPAERRQKAAEQRPLAAAWREQEPAAREVYARLMDRTAVFLAATDQPYCEQYEAVTAACASVAEALKTNQALLGLTVHSTADDYLKAHTANTVILSLAMGLQAGLSQPELRLLGFCAMAHDCGMTSFKAISESGRQLSKEDFEEMALHAEAGAAKLDRIVDLDYKVRGRARRIVLQIHERVDGTGYPDRTSGEELDQLSQIIALADAFEAMTHPRSWRGPISPPDAVRELIEKEGRGFNAHAVKLLVSVVSAFPPGSLVLLSDERPARVLTVNRGSLTRPLVELLGGPGRPEVLDLLEHPLTSIERSLHPSELDPETAAAVERASWWTGRG